MGTCTRSCQLTAPSFSPALVLAPKVIPDVSWRRRILAGLSDRGSCDSFSMDA
jgi:hypothetical protein